MFNLYQTINKKDDENKEANVIGHERFYQERTTSRRSSTRRKKKQTMGRRAQSATEFPTSTLTAANKRLAYRTNRSRSSENQCFDSTIGVGKSTPQRVESFAKLLFPKRTASVQKHEYTALKTDGGGNTEKYKIEKQIRNGAFMTCKHYLTDNNRYELKTQLDEIGLRSEKHWFIIQDNSLGAERLLTLLQLPSQCPISPSMDTCETILELFRGLQHPYIHPVLDIEFWDRNMALITPLNQTGSLRDLIYGSLWHEEYEKKYKCRGDGLPLGTVQCLGRQILEALLFLRNRHFPSFYYLHSGNVIIQNGVARLAGLENALLNLTPSRAPYAPETQAFGYLLFEMTTGYELCTPPTPAHLQLELERAPKVADILEIIFQQQRTLNLEELIYCELFRGLELRELRGANIQYTSSPEVMDLLDIIRNPVPPSPIRRKDVVVIVEERRLEDIIEEDNEDSDSNMEIVCR